MIQAVLLMGAPGVGKTTQARLLSAYSGWPHVSTGDLLRALPADSQEASRFRERAVVGGLADDDLVVGVWERWARGLASRGVADLTAILDGFPRTHAQLQPLYRLTRPAAIVYLTGLGDDELVTRMSRRSRIESRVDDGERAALEERIEQFREFTAPLSFQLTGAALIAVNAVGSEREVCGRVANGLRNVGLLPDRGGSLVGGCLGDFEDVAMPRLLTTG